ncbi:MAG TPA: alkaline phosphatase D family protein, partial [Chthoniobacterales bacterium]|nr:alkaline phosphatase D family protein [Chthoniobacterales bacterium]
MHRALALLIVALAVSRAVPASEAPLKRVAFGSCTREYKPQPLWKAIITAQPDVWIWLGDIVYGEADNLEDLARRYRTLKEHPDYTALRGQAKVLGIWDDHDYGTTDGGSDNPRKRDVQKLLLDFLDEPADSPRRTQQGVYAAYTFGHAE